MAAVTLRGARANLFRQYDTAWRVLAEADERGFSTEHRIHLFGYLNGLDFALHVVGVDHSACKAHPLAAQIEALHNAK